MINNYCGAPIASTQQQKQQQILCGTPGKSLSRMGCRSLNQSEMRISKKKEDHTATSLLPYQDDYVNVSIKSTPASRQLFKSSRGKSLSVCKPLTANGSRQYSNVLSLQQKSNNNKDIILVEADPYVSQSPGPNIIEGRRNQGFRKSISVCSQASSSQSAIKERNGSLNGVQLQQLLLQRRNGGGHQRSSGHQSQRGLNLIIEQQEGDASRERQSAFQVLMTKLQNKMTPGLFQKFKAYILSSSFMRIINEQFIDKGRGGDQSRSILDMLRDFMGVTLTSDDLQTIIEHVGAVSYGPAVVARRQKVSSVDSQYSPTKDSCYGSAIQDQRSTVASSIIDSSSFITKTSTVFSRPFTCYSYTSSTTAGTSLTQKIQRMNRATVQQVAKQMIHCAHQIEQSLAKQQLDMKTKLTISEIQYFLQKTDLANISFTNLQSILISVLFIQQPSNNELLISFKSLLQACQNFIDQSDIDCKDIFNKSKLEKIMDDIRDFIYLKQSSQYDILKKLFIKFTECESADQYDKALMTKEHFLKFVKHIIGEKYSSREIEQMYRNIVSQKAMTFKRFQKFFTHAKVQESWLMVGLKQLREFMLRKRLDSESTFQRFAQITGQTRDAMISKSQWRDIIKKENLSFNIPQMDFLFDSFDLNRDGKVDISEWLTAVKDDVVNPLQLLREIVSRHHLTADDLLYRMQKRVTEPPMGFNTFKECMKRIDQSLTQAQIKSMFDSMASKTQPQGKAPMVEMQTLLRNLTQDTQEAGNFSKEIGRQLQKVLAENKDIYKQLKSLLERADIEQEGFVDKEDLAKILKQLKTDILPQDIDRFVNQLKKDQRGRINYQKLVLKLEKAKDNYPIKSLAIRLSVFLQQNDLNVKTLLEKLVETKNASKTNQTRNKASSDLISINFFAKFIKAKVDKKRSFEEIKSLVQAIDMDKDGNIGQSDLEAFVGRANFHHFFENSKLKSMRSHSKPSQAQIQSIAQLENNLQKLQSSKYHSNQAPEYSEPNREDEATLYPTQQQYQNIPREMTTLTLNQIVTKVREGMEWKRLRFPEAFALLDRDQVGLVSFDSFSKNIDKITPLSQAAKEFLFAKIDTFKIGLISQDQFKDVVNRDEVGIRMLNGENQKRIGDSFDWEQGVIRLLLDWILDKRLSLSEAFKIIDIDFDGVIDINDLKSFLRDSLKIDLKVYGSKIERLYRILDLSKSDRIYQVDFEKMFTEVFKSKQSITRCRSKSIYQKDVTTGGYTIDWIDSCKNQIAKYLLDNFLNVDESFTCITQSDENCNGSGERKLAFNDFFSFIQGRNVLKGFNLTKELILKLFASLDSHRKGFLTISDWKLAFANCIKADEMIFDIKRSVGASFTNLEEAHQFMASKSGSEDINEEGFRETINHLMPARFSNKQLSQVWDSIKDKDTTLSYYAFVNLFNDTVFRVQSSFQQTVAKHLTRSSSDTNLESKVVGITDHHFFTNGSKHFNHSRMSLSKPSATIKQQVLNELKPRQSSFTSISLVMDKLRKILKSRGIANIKDLFEGRNASTIVEFKNVIKVLGLSPREIDLIYESIQTTDGSGMVDLATLIKKFSRLELDYAALEKTNSQRIANLRHFIVKYMNSVEDAFHLYDSGSKGKMTFVDFQQLLIHLYCECQGVEAPAQPLARDLFDLIDIKQDGLIDFYEWIHTFDVKKEIAREDFLTGQQMPDQRQKQLRGYPASWLQSKPYQDLLHAAARNSKPLRLMYMDLDQEKTGVCDFDIGVAVFIKFVRDTLDLPEKQYPATYLQDMVRPFGELLHGKMMLKHKDFTNTLKNRHFLTRQATNNKHASHPEEVVTANYANQ